MGPEEEKYKKWEADQRNNHGLVDIHFTLNPDLKSIDVENICLSINHALEEKHNGNGTVLTEAR